MRKIKKGDDDILKLVNELINYDKITGVFKSKKSGKMLGNLK